MALKKRRLLFGGSTTLLLLLVMAVGMWSLSAVGDVPPHVARSMGVLRALNMADTMYDALRADVMSALFSDSSARGGNGPADEREAQQHARRLREAMQSARTLADDPHLRSRIETLQVPLQACVASASGLIQRAAGDVQGARGALAQWKTACNQAGARLDALNLAARAGVRAVERAARSARDRLLDVMLGLLLVGSATVGGLLLLSGSSLLHVVDSHRSPAATAAALPGDSPFEGSHGLTAAARLVV